MAKYLNLSGLQTLWTKAKNTFAPKSHTHQIGDVSLLGDSLNAKQDVLSFNDGGRVWEDRCDVGYVYKIGLPSGDTSFANILCQTGSGGGWPIVFSIGYKWNGTNFDSNCTPKLSYLYTTHHAEDDKIITLKYSASTKAIYIKFESSARDHRLAISLSSKRSGSYSFGQISKDDSEFADATSVPTGNVEGCVMKSKIGTSIGNTSKPVYVSSSGFVQQCDSVEADTWDGYHLSVIQNYGEVSLDSNVITFLRT